MVRRHPNVSPCAKLIVFSQLKHVAVVLIGVQGKLATFVVAALQFFVASLGQVVLVEAANPEAQSALGAELRPQGPVVAVFVSNEEFRWSR